MFPYSQVLDYLLDARHPGCDLFGVLHVTQGVNLAPQSHTSVRDFYLNLEVAGGRVFAELSTPGVGYRFVALRNLVVDCDAVRSGRSQWVGQDWLVRKVSGFQRLVVFRAWFGARESPTAAPDRSRSPSSAGKTSTTSRLSTTVASGAREETMSSATCLTASLSTRPVTTTSSPSISTVASDFGEFLQRLLDSLR